MLRAIPKQQQNAEKQHVTTIRLDDNEYRRLRKYIALHEAKTGERLTHQNLFKDALFALLAKNGG